MIAEIDRQRHCLLTIGIFMLLLISCGTAGSTNSLQGNNDYPKQSLNCPNTSLPWNIDFLGSDTKPIIANINMIFENSGLAGEGGTILNLSKQYKINPAFALSMFRKEASFAKPGTRANNNNNPGNIIATGDCKGVPANQACNGYYGEISTDGHFGIYKSMAEGIRAYYMLLSAEYKPGTKRNCEDIPCIISAYSPKEENNTTLYIQQVSDWTEEYQCQILGVVQPITLAPASSKSPAISSTLAVATGRSNTGHIVQYDCSDGEHLTPEEQINCGKHQYDSHNYTKCPNYSYGEDAEGHAITDYHYANTYTWTFSPGHASLLAAEGTPYEITFKLNKTNNNTYERKYDSNGLSNLSVYQLSQVGFNYKSAVLNTDAIMFCFFEDALLQ